MPLSFICALLRHPLPLAAALSLGLLAACGGDDGPPEPPPPPASDPLSGEQWFLDNRGQTAFATVGGRPGVDLNLQSVHEAGILGQGVPVLVVDSGLQPDHEDLADNVVPSMLHSYDRRSVSQSDPRPIVESDGGEAHGTAVAGIIGAVANNGLGGASVAPGAALGGVRYLCEGDESVACQSTIHFVQLMGLAPFSRDAWILNGSFGGEGRQPLLVFSYDRDAKIVALEGLSALRDGKGALFIKAAGNAFRSVTPEGDEPPRYVLCAAARNAGLTCHNASTEITSLPPNTVVVGAVNADGGRSSYSSAGSVLLVAGLGGEFGLDADFRPSPVSDAVPGPALVTTDWEGCQRGMAQWADDGNYRNAFDNPGSELARERNPDCRYTAIMNGTSSAAPTVSGVVALMLSANPELTWRDVRDILVTTSRRDVLQAPPEVRLPLQDGTYVADAGWQRNAAGHWHSNWYGYGLVDAKAAVAAAQARGDGRLSGPMRDLGWIDGEAVWPEEPEDEDDPLPVPPGSVAGAEMLVEVAESLTIESLVLSIALQGEGPLGEIGIEVVSPAGTRSVLLNPFTIWGEAPASSGAIGIPLASEAFYGEDSRGTWSVRVVDVNARGASEPEIAVNEVEFRLRGH